jgi:RNA polymerase sigma-70 factor (ECF subfamily)
MNELDSPVLTQLLVAWNEGDPTALDRLIPIVYQNLRRLARRHMSLEPAGHVLQTTALVNEVYLRLADQRRPRWQNRAHFFAIAAQLMRRILVSMARARNAGIRGGDLRHVCLDDMAEISAGSAATVAAIDDALNALEALDERKCRVVELRFFCGLSVEETAEVLKVSPETVMREWKRAKAWLYSELAGSPQLRSAGA